MIRAVIFDNFGVLYIGAHRRNTELLSFAQSLRPGKKVGLLSNTSRGMLGHYFTETELTELFDAVILSGEVGMMKPYPDIYRLAADRLGVSPQDCLFVDDSQDNCAGAEAAGMKAVWYQSNRQAITEIHHMLASAP